MMDGNNWDLMWDIDSRVKMGETISEKQQIFYNAHIDEMRAETYDDYHHWQCAKPFAIIIEEKNMLGSINQEFLYKVLGEIVNKIEDCGASTELTNAVCLAADLQQAVGNEYNTADDYALKRVIDEINFIEKKKINPKYITPDVLVEDEIPTVYEDSSAIVERFSESEAAKLFNNEVERYEKNMENLKLEDNEVQSIIKEKSAISRIEKKWHYGIIVDNGNKPFDYYVYYSDDQLMAAIEMFEKGTREYTIIEASPIVIDITRSMKKFDPRTGDSLDKKVLLD